MKKRFFSIIILLLCFTLIVGCGKSDNKEVNDNVDNSSNTSEGLTRKQIYNRLDKIYSDTVELWNNVFCEVDWYTSYGTSSIGEELDIDYVLAHAKEYYDTVIKNKDFVNTLNDDYNEVKAVYEKIVDKATIIYNNIMNEKPVANQKISYRNELDLYGEYQRDFYQKIYDAYMQGENKRD